MKSTIKIMFTSVLLLSIVFACNKDEVSNDEVQVKNNSTEVNFSKAYYAPWVYVMDWRFSRETCATGPGICFKNDDGDIWDYGIWNNVWSPGNGEYTIEQVKGFLEDTDINSGLDDNVGTIGYHIEGDYLRMIFSETLDESSLVISEDTKLAEGVAAMLGKSEIIIPSGNYSLSYRNFEHGEVLVPFNSRDIILDYHQDYGEILKIDYPVGSDVNLSMFLEDLGILRSDLRSYQIVEANFTGTALVQHVIDGKNINVWHEYTDEPVAIFEGVLTNGQPVTSQRIHFCGNGFGGYNTFDFFWAFIDNGCWWC